MSFIASSELSGLFAGIVAASLKRVSIAD